MNDEFIKNVSKHILKMAKDIPGKLEESEYKKLISKIKNSEEREKIVSLYENNKDDKLYILKDTSSIKEDILLILRKIEFRLINKNYYDKKSISEKEEYISSLTKILELHSKIISEILRKRTVINDIDENGFISIDNLIDNLNKIFVLCKEYLYKENNDLVNILDIIFTSLEKIKKYNYQRPIIEYTITKSYPAKSGENVGRGGRYRVKKIDNIIYVANAYGHKIDCGLEPEKIYSLANFTFVHGTL